MSLYVLYAASAYFAVPRLVADHIVNLARIVANSDFSAHDIVFNPFTLSLHIIKPVLKDRDDSVIWFQADNMIVNMDGLSSLFRRAVVLDNLTLQHPVIYLQQQQDLTWRYPRVSTASNTTAQEGFGLYIRRLYLSDGWIYWRQAGDQPVSLTFAQVTYEHENLNTGHAPSRFSLSAETATGDSLQIGGRYVHQPQFIDATWHVEKLNIPHWLATWRLTLPDLSIQQAFLHGDGTLRWTGTDKQLKLLSDKLALKAVHLTLTRWPAVLPDGEGRKYPEITIPNIRLQEFTLSLPAKKLDIRRILLENASARVPIQALSAIGGQPQTAHANIQAVKPPATGLSWHVAHVAASHSQLQLLSPTAHGAPVVNFDTLRVDNLSNTSLDGSIRMELTAPVEKADDGPSQVGHIRITGKLNIARATASLTHRVERFFLTPWLPLLQRHLKIDQITGHLNSTGQWRLSPNTISAEFQATVFDFSMRDNHHHQLLAWRRWDLQQTRIDSQQRLLRLGPVTVQDLSGDIPLETAVHHIGLLLHNQNMPDEKKKIETGPAPWRVEWQGIRSTGTNSIPADNMVEPTRLSTGKLVY